MAQKTTWTNPSVLAFAGDSDPIDAIERRAREAVLQAFDKGWSGPPFDPIRLADILNIVVRPQTDVVDARTVPTDSGNLVIEFNPRQPRERLRFSVAHEIAHTFFPDCARAVRHRSGRDHSRGDDWQLEMLCNIAAAEIVMPIGDMSRLTSGTATIERLMNLRAEFDVSPEALLIRTAKLAEEPLIMFCASRIGTDDAKGFRIDYSIPSRACSHYLPTGTIISPDSVLRECTAIGYTAHKVERWPGLDADLEVQCVGLAPYPNTRYPRVAGIAKTPRSLKVSVPRITYLRGNALEPRGSGLRMICHIVNDGAFVWGGNGFAANVRRRYPSVQEDFQQWARSGAGRLRLGNVHFATISDKLIVASMIAQRGFGDSATPRIRYSALERCLETVADKCDRGTSLHMPRIGTGAAGGSWTLIEAMLVDKVLARRIPINVYDSPNTPVAAHRDLFSEIR